ncbi:EboA domain-containing protein [Micromonospora sp. NBC_01813]|uniref:EboA domain-containing protein n=1 Tax=Micromonospora sp. NBC_01813 TaxID=2975988 RepID=UPI002DDB08BD|nr:EboA domain-containing protein [Micromonospora sp. NBC_01813]WSA09368.1 EboA domain-containing protein [Micromonospora sp. NBC_01813]
MNQPTPTGTGPDTDGADVEIGRLADALRGVPDPDWLAAARTRIVADPAGLPALFAAAGRRCGRADLAAAPGWSADEAARALLLADLSTVTSTAELAAAVDDCYHHGDAAERRAVLKALPLLPVGDRAVPLLHDAIRTNDTRLVAAALGHYARHLDQPAWRQAVLKCVFTGVPLAAVHDLDARADGELLTMLAGLDEERTAADRTLPADALALLARLRAADAAAPADADAATGGPTTTRQEG